MAKKSQCEKCDFFRQEVELCTLYWRTPIFDGMECSKENQKDLIKEDEPSMDSFPSQPEHNKELLTYTYGLQHRNTTLTEEVVFTSGFGKTLNIFFVLVAVSAFCGLLGLLFDIVVMTVLGFFFAFVFGVSIAFNYLPMNRHKDDFVMFNDRGIQWKHGEDAGLINWDDIHHCEYVFNPSKALYEEKVYLRAITGIGKENIIDMTGISHKMTNIVSIVNRLSGRELLNLSDTKKQRWKSVAKALLLLLLYLLYRLFIQVAFD